MKLINKSTGKIVTKNLKIASNWLEASLGLLNQPKGTAILFHTRWGIHTFGMKYPIDVFVLDNQLKIAQIKRNLKPNRIFFWNPIYEYIIEKEAKESKTTRERDELDLLN